MVLTNLEIKFEQTDSAINYFLKYLLFADDHKICQNEIVSHPPTSASLCMTLTILLKERKQIIEKMPLLRLRPGPKKVDLGSTPPLLGKPTF